jgi:glutamate racemase
MPDLFSELAALCPVGAFDSGIGGLSVIAEIRKRAPNEDIIYFGDNANCPYGGRSDEWLRARSLEITDFLLERGAKAIVVACNTASAAGLEHLRALRKVPIIGLVPAVKPAVAATRSGVIGVLATQAAIRGGLLSDVIECFANPANVDVVKVAPVGLVEAVEAGELQSPQTARAVLDAVTPRFV